MHNELLSAEWCDAFSARVIDGNNGNVLWKTNKVNNPDATLPSCDLDQAYYPLWSSSEIITTWAAAKSYEIGLFGDPNISSEGLNSKVVKYLPNFANMGEYANNVTIKHILTHSSGIPQIGFLDVDDNHHLYLDKFFENIVFKTKKLAPYFKLGSGTKYGYGISFIGRILEILHKKPLSYVLDDLIFDKFNMNKTGFYIPENKRDHIFTNPHPDAHTYPPDNLLCMGGECLWSTPSDFATMCTVLANKGIDPVNKVQLCNSDTFKLWTTPVKHHCPELGSMGLGCQHFSHGRMGRTGLTGATCEIDTKKNKAYIFFTHSEHCTPSGHEVNKLVNMF